MSNQPEHGKVIHLTTPSKMAPLGHTSIQPKQMHLPLSGERKLIMVATEGLHGVTFLRKLTQESPRVLLDLRFAPHFRLPGLTDFSGIRESARLGISYVVKGVPFHEIRKNVFQHDLSKLANNLLKIAYSGHKPIGALMVLVQREADAAVFKTYFLLALEEADHHPWSYDLIA